MKKTSFHFLLLASISATSLYSEPLEHASDAAVVVDEEATENNNGNVETITPASDAPPVIMQKEEEDASSAPPYEPTTGVVKNLSDALLAAYNNNTTLCELRRQMLAVSEKSVQANAGWLPTVTASGNVAVSQTNNSGNAKMGDGGFSPSAASSTQNQRQGAMTVSQNVFSGGSTVASIRSADMATRSQWANGQVEEQKVFSAIIETYLDLISKKAEIELLQANQVAVAKNLAAATDKMKIGEETRTQVAIAEAKLADANSRLETSKATFEAIKATFYSLTGMRPADTLEIPTPDKDLPKELKIVLDHAMQKHPTVIQAQYTHLQSRYDVEKMKGGYYPQVDIEGKSSRTETRSASSYVSTARDFRSNDFGTNHQVLLSVKYPLFDAGKTNSLNREAMETSSAKRIAIEGARLSARKNAIEAYENYQAAVRNIINYEAQVKASEVSLEGTRQEMAVGSKILLDVLRAQAELLESQLNLVKAKRDALVGSYKILASMGNLTAMYLKLNPKPFHPQNFYKVISQGEKG